MKNDKIFKAIGDIDSDLIDRAAANENKKHASFAPRLKWAAPVAACLSLAIALVVAALPGKKPPVPDREKEHGITEGDLAETEKPSEAHISDPIYAATLDDCIGLPTSDYTWDEGSGVQADRMWIGELQHLFWPFGMADTEASFAIVNVVSVTPFTDPSGVWSGEGQIAEFDPIYNVIGDGIILPVMLRQYLYGGCTGGEATNLLRVGGVYVLPLVRMAGEEYYTIYGDLDVLFEVDDRQLIHSHSREPGFNKYNGTELQNLWNDIEFLSTNSSLLHTQLAYRIAEGFEIDITETDIALYEPSSGWSGRCAEDAESFSAKIIDGRVVIETGGFNVFRAVEGMTAEEIIAAAQRISEYIASK